MGSTTRSLVACLIKCQVSQVPLQTRRGWFLSVWLPTFCHFAVQVGGLQLLSRKRTSTSDYPWISCKRSLAIWREWRGGSFRSRLRQQEGAGVQLVLQVRQICICVTWRSPVSSLQQRIADNYTRTQTNVHTRACHFSVVFHLPR